MTAVGGAGDDTIRGGGGNDRIIGGRGNDNLQGNAGNDIIVDTRGDDHLNGGPGTDICVDRSGTDTFVSCERQVPAPTTRPLAQPSRPVPPRALPRGSRNSRIQGS